MPEEYLSKEEADAKIEACSVELSEVIKKHFMGFPQLTAIYGLSNGFETAVAHNLGSWHGAHALLNEVYNNVHGAIVEEHEQMVISSLPEIKEYLGGILGVDPDKIEVLSVNTVALDPSGTPVDTEQGLREAEEHANESNT